MAGEVLRKKVQSMQQAALAGGPGAERAWRVAFARAARDMMQLPVDFLSLSTARVSLPELLDMPTERALILMLEGPEDGLGLLVLSPDLLSSLVEVLTLGKCGTQTPDPRKPTRTDAAMITPVADLALSHLEEALAEDADLVWTSGFRYASFIEEARALGLLLEDITFRCLTARLSLANGARAGDMTLILPADGRGRKPRMRSDAVPEAVARPAFAAALAHRVEEANCQIDAVLARLSMPLAEVMRLSVDMVLPLPNAALDQIRFEGMDGRAVTVGKLGQQRGMRAIRLAADGWEEGRGGPAVASAVRPSGGAADAPAPSGFDPIATDFGENVSQGFDFASFPATGTD
ncbi:FliM/FliN family flagellar motor switch protein [Pseudotabrizicola algicola]|uniref:FliM/FliN family flagellar motor switch protein n=1 Tax=Pseudotabrizicola algicola TaxID=2709381 RepID=UPI0013DF6EE6